MKISAEIKKVPGLFLWNRLKEAAAITDRDGWQKSCDFAGNSILKINLY